MTSRGEIAETSTLPPRPPSAASETRLSRKTKNPFQRSTSGSGRPPSRSPSSTTKTFCRRPTRASARPCPGPGRLESWPKILPRRPTFCRRDEGLPQILSMPLRRSQTTSECSDSRRVKSRRDTWTGENGFSRPRWPQPRRRRRHRQRLHHLSESIRFGETSCCLRIL